MKLKKFVVLTASHSVIGVLGFMLGIYLLPILIAPPAPSDQMVEEKASQALFSADFVKDLKDSDAFHWGEGKVSVGADSITLKGQLAPGPDYKLYLSPEFVETEEAFNRTRPQMVQVGDVKTFENFTVDVPPGIDVAQYTSVIVWCESFGEFITAAKYR